MRQTLQLMSNNRHCHLTCLLQRKTPTINQWSQQKTCAGTGNNEQLGCRSKFGTKLHKSYLLLTKEFGIQGYTHRMMLHCITGGGEDKTLGGKGWGASGTSIVQQFFTSILPMTLQATGTSLISATATRNQVYLPYSNTLKVFSSPFPEFGTGSHGQNKLEFMAIISLVFFLLSLWP